MRDGREFLRSHFSKNDAYVAGMSGKKLCDHRQVNQHPSCPPSIKTARWLVMLVVAMFSLAFAAVPLYRIFCKATGFAGTPRVALEKAVEDVMIPSSLEASKPLSSDTINLLASEASETRLIRVQLDANVDRGLPWHFYPENHEITVPVGKQVLTFYIAENTASYPVSGMAVYNVAPEKMGQYFTKIHCFCFEEQTLRPHERVRMPVLFRLDPALLDDQAMDGVDVITLSYHFFKQE